MADSHKKYLPYILLVGVATLAVTVWKSNKAPELTPVIQTAQGPVQGVITESGFANFKGLPFAAPPVGDLRWRAPASAPTWTDTRQAAEFSPMCMQVTAEGNDSFFERIIDGSGLSTWKEFLIKRVAARLPVSPVSEDCLYLNVRTPAISAEGMAKKKLPVMVWIHGGGHQFGSGDFTYYQADGIPAQDIVLVTINYRLGAFGYMAHPALSADDPNGVSGNYGALDQIAALEWVRDNISAYGGDADNVTIFGESAGAWSVTEMMASPLAAGLFHKAIGQSGSSVYHMGQMEGEGVGWVSGYATSKKLEAALGLENASAETLRALPAAKILSTITPDIADGFNHVADGYVFPMNVGLAFKSGQYNKVPVLFGYNADEGSLFYPTDQNPTVWKEGFPTDGTRAQMIDYLSEPFPTQAETLVDLYGLDKDSYQGGMDLMGDEIFGMNVRYTLERAEADGQPAWAYTWNRVPPGDKQTVGAFHSAELPFVFDSYNPILGYSNEDKAVTELMLNYWTNFARTGNPNSSDMPSWPEYEGQNWMAFEANTDKQTRMVQGWRKAKLDALTEGLAVKFEELESLSQPAAPETKSPALPSGLASEQLSRQR